VAAAAVGFLTLLGVRMVTRSLESELTQSEAAIDQMQRGMTVPDLRLPLLGEEIERGIPAFVQQSQAAQAQLAGAAKAPE
jgi:hypothetical protein